MLVDRSTRLLLTAGSALIALAGAAPAGAQSVSSGEDPFEVGAKDGRRLGLSQGRVEGRAQALYGSFRDGFRQGLAEAREQGAGGGFARQLELEGRTTGLEQGRPAGREAGATAALAGWLEQGGLPPRRQAQTPPAATEQGPEVCRPARVQRLPLVREYAVDINPEGLEERESPVVVDSFDLAYPSLDDLRTRARAAGATSEAVGFWVRDYKDAFQSAWHETFESERSGTPMTDREELEGLGLRLGREEGERRLACQGGAERWQSGFESGWAEAWGSGFDEAWKETNERHSKRAVVIVQDPRLIDASGDGLLEPGEGLRLEARLVNAGAVEATRSAGSWGALRGLESEGHLEGGLAPGASRDLKLELGTVDEDAPSGTSVVVRLRGLGSEAITLSERLGRPARIQEAEARLAISGGRLVAEVRAQVRSVSPASERAELELAGRGGGSAQVGRLKDGESRTVSLLVPASAPMSIGSPVTGVFVLRTSEGLPWHAGRWSAPFGLADAVATAGESGAPAQLGAALLKHLVEEWTAALATGEKTSLPAALEAYANALEGLAPGPRERIEDLVTTPLLERIEDRTSPKRLRKQARELLAS